MEKDFATLYAEEEAAAKDIETTETEETEEVETETEETETETEETEVDDTDDEAESESGSESDEDKGFNNEESKKTKSAFSAAAEMRTKLKEAEKAKGDFEVANKALQAKLDRFEKISKELSFKNADDLLQKTEEKLIIQRAEREGRSVEDIQKDMERDQKIADLEAKLSARDKKEVEERYSNTVTEFVSSNKLSDQDVESIESQLAVDGFTLDMLQSMQPKVLKKLLETYIPKKIDKQKELEQKVKLKNEIPLDQSSNAAESEDVEVEKLYNLLSKK